MEYLEISEILYNLDQSEALSEDLTSEEEDFDILDNEINKLLDDIDDDLREKFPNWDI